MATVKPLNQVYFVLLMLSVMACNRPRRLYLSNKTDKAITLSVDATFAIDTGSIQSSFKDSLDGKRIEPGSITINFGGGKWNESEEKSLKELLPHIAVSKDGSAKIFRLPENIQIGHGLLIAELIIKIDEP